MGSDHLEDTRSPSELIDARIEDLGDWRGEMLARIRALVLEAEPAAHEEWKWRGTPTWEHNGMICTGETYKNHVKVTFARGASLDDPDGLFNSSLEGNSRRAIDIITATNSPRMPSRRSFAAPSSSTNRYGRREVVQ
jgi:hypothetical protein